jgi:hypothetical protein
MSSQISCAVCGGPCKLVYADPDNDAPGKFGGWYCDSCDCFVETDIELED